MNNNSAIVLVIDSSSKITVLDSLIIKLIPNIKIISTDSLDLSDF